MISSSSLRLGPEGIDDIMDRIQLSGYEVMTHLRGCRWKSWEGTPEANDIPAVLQMQAMGLSSRPSPDFDLFSTDVLAETLYPLFRAKM
jgi:hypothetical protein